MTMVPDDLLNLSQVDLSQARLLGPGMVGSGGCLDSSTPGVLAPLRGARPLQRPHPGPTTGAATGRDRRSDVVEVTSRHPEIYGSARGGQHPRPPPGAGRVLRRHGLHRRPAPRPAPPDRIGRLQPTPHQEYRGHHRGGGRPGHRSGYAALGRATSPPRSPPVPLEIICDMMGVPASGPPRVRCSNVVLAGGDPGTSRGD